MKLSPIEHLTFAYQLHYYLCWQTHRLRELSSAEQHVLRRELPRICRQYDMHLLSVTVQPTHLRVLLSLKPEHRISRTVQTLKSLTGRAVGWEHPWAHGYLARTTGRVRKSAVAEYLQHQETHHEYHRRVRSPVRRFRRRLSVSLSPRHADVELNYHVVLSTEWRQGLFDSSLAEALWAYWQRVANKHGFGIGRATILPDHIHLMVALHPTQAPAQAVSWLMNNGQYFLGKHYGQAIIHRRMGRVWMPSCYIGAVGEWSTAQLEAYLRKCGGT